MQEAIHTRTRTKFEVVDITTRVAELVKRASVQEGICTVFVRHATAAIIINENADAGFRLDPGPGWPTAAGDLARHRAGGV